jgi:glycosyltransferase involved in cell wall biosynthesis
VGGGKSVVFVVAPGGLNDRAGIGRLVSTTARAWRENGDGFRVIDPYGPAVLAIAPLYFARALLQIVWNAWQGRIRLLHVHMAARGSAVRKGIIVHLGARLGLPVIVHLHGSGLDEFYRRLPRFAQRRLCRTLERADRVVVLGQYWRRVLVDRMGIDPKRVLVLPNAVAGPPHVRKRAAEGPCRILFLGRMEEKKGLPELLDALSDERLAKLEWSVLVAGAGDNQAYRRRAAALGLAERVEFHGWAPESEVHRWLTEADIFVLPSHHEGLSMALLEAMAFGLAVVTTPAGGNADAIVDGISGVFVPVGDRRALASALTRVIADGHLRVALQASARKRYAEHFDIAAYCRRLQTLYREVCEGADARAPRESDCAG